VAFLLHLQTPFMFGSILNSTIVESGFELRLRLYFVSVAALIREFGFAQIHAGEGRTQWPPCLRHESSSPARTLGSCIRNPLEA
jgi:hypothetical protein